MSGKQTTVESKCPFCKYKENVVQPLESEGEINIFATPPTQVEAIFDKDNSVWRPGYKGMNYYWNQTFGISPIHEKNVRYWARTMECKQCGYTYEDYLFEKGNNHKKMWPYLSNNTYPYNLLFFDRFINQPHGTFLAILMGFMLGLFALVPAFISGEGHDLVSDASYLSALIIYSMLMGGIVYHLKNSKNIRSKWKAYLRELCGKSDDNKENSDDSSDSWNFWYNFTEARFQGSNHKITQPVGAGLFSVFLLFISLLIFSKNGIVGLTNSFGYGATISVLIFYGIIAFFVGIAMWISLESTLIVIRTFSQFPLKINHLDQKSNFNEISKFALSGSFNLTLIFMIPTLFSVISYYGKSLYYIDWVILWINILIAAIFMWVACTIPNKLYKITTVVILLIYLVTIWYNISLVQTSLILTTSIIASVSLSLLIILSFLSGMYPIYDIVKKSRENKINHIDKILGSLLNIFDDNIIEKSTSSIEHAELIQMRDLLHQKTPIELHDLIKIRNILYNKNDFFVLNNQLPNVILLSQIPLMSNIVFYFINLIFDL